MTTQSENTTEKKERDEFGNFKQSITGFVLDVTPEISADVKSVLVEVIKNHTDRAFVYHPDVDEVPLQKGPVVSTLLSFGNPGYDLGSSVRHSVLTIEQEDVDEKTLFVITNKATEKDEYGCMKALGANRDRVDVVFLCIGEAYDKFNLKKARKNKTTVKGLLKSIINKGRNG